MLDIEGIIIKVNDMDSDANTIENEIEHFFSSLKLKPSIFKAPNGSIREIDLPHTFARDMWGEPNKELAEYHRHIIKHYEKWYNQALFLIREYNKNAEFEFTELQWYKRKLYWSRSLEKFYSSGDQNGYCFLWNIRIITI